MTAADQALEFVTDDTVIGLGSGRAAMAFVRALGARVAAGLRVRGVPTSKPTADLAAEVGVPLVAFEDIESIDVTFDGADEVDPDLNLIKGYGGALVREKIVASLSKKLIILVGAEKLVTVLGARGILPVEVVPFGLTPCRRHLSRLGFDSIERMTDGRAFVTDNGNYILDVKVSAIREPTAFEQRILAIPGVVGTGLFIGMADAVVVQDGDSVEVRKRSV